jgi:flagellar basal body-associated protein FliL
MKQLFYGLTTIRWVPIVVVVMVTTGGWFFYYTVSLKAQRDEARQEVAQLKLVAEHLRTTVLNLTESQKRVAQQVKQADAKRRQVQTELEAARRAAQQTPIGPDSRQGAVEWLHEQLQ